MNHTTNYQLSQWVKSDKVQMEDFNADNAKIDAALKAASDARAAMQTALNQKGNCSIGTFTYTGNGTYGSSNPTQVTFPRRPTAYMIFGSGIMIGRGGEDRAGRVVSISGGSSVGTVSTSWSGSTLFITDNSANNQLNQNLTTYQVIAFYAEF